MKMEIPQRPNICYSLTRKSIPSEKGNKSPNQIPQLSIRKATQINTNSFYSMESREPPKSEPPISIPIHSTPWKAKIIKTIDEQKLEISFF